MKRLLIIACASILILSVMAAILVPLYNQPNFAEASFVGASEHDASYVNEESGEEEEEEECDHGCIGHCMGDCTDFCISNYPPGQRSECIHRCKDQCHDQCQPLETFVANPNTIIERTGNYSFDEQTGEILSEYRAYIYTVPSYMPNLET